MSKAINDLKREHHAILSALQISEGAKRKLAIRNSFTRCAGNR